MFGRRGGQATPSPEWSRQKMLALLIGAGATAVLLAVGLVLAVVYAVHPAPASRRAGHDRHQRQHDGRRYR